MKIAFRLPSGWYACERYPLPLHQYDYVSLPQKAIFLKTDVSSRRELVWKVYSRFN
ncbi:hypothetical protein [Paenibacillus polymyxa]|uniref:hypothetical protein n=1 Tax=Paenibacillus polymyxa TaxID=1406 RepID=UPI002379D9B4|nr:hypothetical protein [Paenibacillus polymyxa]